MSNMDELETLIARLRAEEPSRIRSLADETGIPYGTLRKLRAGTTVNPRYTTLRKLKEHYVERRADVLAEQAVAMNLLNRQMG